MPLVVYFKHEDFFFCFLSPGVKPHDWLTEEMRFKSPP